MEIKVTTKVFTKIYLIIWVESESFPYAKNLPLTEG